MAYENNAVVARIARKENLNEATATEVFEDTKRFLYLCGSKGDIGSIAPPPMVDEGWHAFILFTEDYATFCQRFFGRFIHHRPRRPEDPVGDGSVVQRTLTLVDAVFGGPPSRWWVFREEKANCSPSTNCQETKCDGDGACSDPPV